MSSQYQYVKLDNYYFCLKQNPIVLAWILFFKREDLITIQPWLKKKSIPLWRKICSRYYWNIFKRNLSDLLLFIQYRLTLQKADIVTLPVYGHFGMSVHRGYKIFNLHRDLVTKIFDPDVDKSSIKREVEQLKRVSKIDFAPSLRKWDIDGRWYQEDYVRSNIAAAHRSSDSGVFLEAFHEEALPCMYSLMLFQRPVAKALSVYLKELMSILDVNLSGKPMYSKDIDIFREFVHSVAEKLNAEASSPVLLVTSHGDFCPANFLLTKNGLKIVDWETFDFRSLLFDFYSYFFYRPVNMKISIGKMADELEQAMPLFMSKLHSAGTDIAVQVPFSGDLYRRLYYLEYLCKLVRRTFTDSRLNIMDYILRYIDAFNQYELNINAHEFKENKTGICAE